MKRVAATETWWDERSVPATGLVWRIGPLALQIQRLDDEWQIAHHHADEDATDWSVAPASGEPSELGTLARYALSAADNRILLRPRPADRSVVARSRAPLHVLAGEEARIYVSAPVWVEVAAGQPPRPLCETPSRRMTDTWFGASTRDGEVAYSLRTHAHAKLESLPKAAYRAITPVRIHNRAEQPLALDRMNLPVPYLSVFCDDAGALWTEAVTLASGEDSEMAAFEIGSGPPDEARGAGLLGEPRLASRGNPLVRAFGRLLQTFHHED